MEMDDILKTFSVSRDQDEFLSLDNNFHSANINEFYRYLLTILWHDQFLKTQCQGDGIIFMSVKLKRIIISVI